MRQHRTVDEPHSRETRIANAVLEAAKAADDHHEGDRVIVLVTNDTAGGMGLAGYFEEGGDEAEEVATAVADLLSHTRAILRSHGQDLAVLPIPARGQG